MTDDEFEVLDELYFVQSFGDLVDLTGKESQPLTDILAKLYEKGWVRVLEGVDNEVPKDALDLSNRSEQYHYLATKEGLMAHNTTD